MFLFNRGRLVITAIFIASLAACGGSGGNGGETPVKNISPSVSAGNDIEANEDSYIQLSGSAEDNDGVIEDIQWQQTTGTNAELNNSSILNPTLKLPNTTEIETLTFLLRVTDDDGATSTDEIQIIVHPVNALPIAEAGEPIEVIKDAAFTLDASASRDDDGTIVSYEWFMNEISLSTEAQYTGQITDIGQYEFVLQVTDNEGAVSEDTIQVSIVNPPEPKPLKLSVIDSVTSATEFSCESYYIDRRLYESSFLTLALMSDIVEDKEGELQQLMQERSSTQQTLISLEDSLPLLEKEIEETRTEVETLAELVDELSLIYQQCGNENGLENCTEERNEFIKARNDEIYLSRSLRDKKDELQTAQSDINRLQEELEDLDTKESQIKQFFANYETTKETFAKNEENLMAYANRKAIDYRLDIDGRLQMNEGETLVHTRVVLGRAKDNLGTFQTPGLMYFAHQNAVPVGGNSSFDWEELSQEYPNYLEKLNDYLENDNTTVASLDYAAFCKINQEQEYSDQEQLLLSSVYLEAFVKQDYEIDNQYLVSINISESLSALTLQANKFGFLTKAKLLELLENDLPGFNVTTTGLLNEQETNWVVDKLKQDYVKKLLSTFSVPTVMQNNEVSCDASVTNWCPYFGWWIRNDNSPINKGEITSAIVEQQTLNDSFSVRDYRLLPIPLSLSLSLSTEEAY